MASAETRLKVLSLFKQIHRTSQHVFKGDIRSLAVVRTKINEEFKKHVDVQEPEKIHELMGVAVEAEDTLRKNVMQARLDETTGNFKLRITKDTHMYENTPFDPQAKLPQSGRRKKKCDDPPGTS